MKKIISRICISVCLLAMILIAPKAYASGSSGHSGFESITFPDQSKARLLVDMSDQQKNEAISKVKWKLFGWSTHNIYTRQPSYYVGQTIFSRANKTSTPIEFEYAMKVGKTTSNSVAISGGLTSKVSGKIKSISLGVDFKADAEWEKVVKQSEEEKTSFTVKIMPDRKISLFIKGKAELTNGGCKFFVFGIPVKKGNFEFIDVVTEYYELCEEKC